MFRFPSGLYFSACLDSLFLSNLCTCCSHFFWYCFISFTVFCTPVFSLIHWFFSLSNFVIPSKCLKNFICAASKRCSSLFFNTQASPPNFNVALAVKLGICYPLNRLNPLMWSIRSFPKIQTQSKFYISRSIYEQCSLRTLQRRRTEWINKISHEAG